LQAVIDRAVILGNGRSLEIGKSLGISQEPHRQSPVATKATVSATSELRSTSSFGLTAENEPFISLEEAQRRHIIAALQRCGGQIEGGSGAAALLQINPLRARMRKLKINWRDYRQGDS
jgi:transcriptional regulator with GAF, ATPase, and Fis domain